MEFSAVKTEVQCPRILIVGDNSKELSPISSLLESEGCDVAIAKSDSDAVTLLGCKFFDVVLIELHQRKFTLSGIFAFDRPEPRNVVIAFCQKINCEYVTMAVRQVSSVNGQPVVLRGDTGSLLENVLTAASRSLAS